MPALVYALCALTSILVAALLVRSHRRTRSRFLLWSSLCFIGLAMNNILLFVDLAVIPDVDLSIVRHVTALVAMLMLIIGLVWESQ